jgi:hypothetical protein
MSTPNPAIEQALAKMLSALSGFLSPVLPLTPGPPPPPNLPDASLSLVSVTERTVGLGNRRGTDAVGPFGVLALKGVRLETVVRYQFWGGEPADADLLISTLQARLSASSALLRTQGFLRVEALSTTLAEHVAALNFWRRTADFQVLFEFRYQDADEAESLIARIPIKIDSVFTDETSVTDDLARWDDEEAPALTVRRKRERTSRVTALTFLAHVPPPPPGWVSKKVSMSLDLAGVTSDEQTFNTLQDFLNAFTPETVTETEPVMLGGKAYKAGRLEFPNEALNFPAVVLSGDRDVFRVNYDAPTQKPRFAIDPDSDTRIESGAIVYLRAL